MSEQHTSEPWSYQASIPEDGFECFFINGESKRISDFDGPQDEEQFSNVRRIVAAVNACAGFSIEELEGASLFNDSISAQDEIDSLKSEVEEMKLIIATDTGTESAVANLQQQVSHMVDMVACEKSNAEYFKRQRDELLAALNAIEPFIPKTSAKEGGAAAYSANVRAADLVRSAIASVKASTQ